MKDTADIPSIEISDDGEDRVAEASLVSVETGPRSRTPSPNRLRDPFSGLKLSALKKKTCQVLSLAHDKDDDSKAKKHDGLLRPSLPSSGTLSGKRRTVSMPVSNPKQKHSDQLPDADPVATRSYLSSGTYSPPIVDFTRFEDRYRSPSNDYDSLFSISKGNKHNEAKSYFPSRSGVNGGVDGDVHKSLEPGYVENGMVHDSPGNFVFYPASERKPDPRLLMDALENASEGADVRSLLDMEELMRIHEMDRGRFELREGDSAVDAKNGSGKARTVFGMSIQDVFRYASRTIILGKRAYILPIVVVHCVEELYRTGIYQSNLFRTLPNRPRLHELISIFDSLEQPAGSIIRSRQPTSSSAHEGFGAATSLHLESTPDICALLTSYISALPEPVLPPDLFEVIWKLCDVHKTYLSEPPSTPIIPSGPSAPVRLSSIPLARSYTPESEATCILISQLVLHLLPSPQFFLFVYLLSFFSQVALVRDENGISVEDLSKMFGTRVFGQGYGGDFQPIDRKGKDKERERNGRGEAMMAWFLRRWGPISETLFEIIDDAKLGLFHWNKRLRKDSFGKVAFRPVQTSLDVVSAPNDVKSDAWAGKDEAGNPVKGAYFEDGDAIGTGDIAEVATYFPIFNAQSHPVWKEPVGKGSLQSSSASSGSSSYVLVPDTDRPSPNLQTIEPDFKLALRNRLHLDSIPSPETGLIGITSLAYNAAPKNSDFGDRMSDVTGSSKTPAVSHRVEDLSIYDAVDDGDTDSMYSFHERLLDASTPSTTLVLSPGYVYPSMPNPTDWGSDSQVSLNAGLEANTLSLPDDRSPIVSSPDQNYYSSSSSSSISKNPFISSHQTVGTRMGPTQALPHRFLAGVCTPSTGTEEKDTSEKDAIINALKDRLLAVERERDEAKKIVTDVRMALRTVVPKMT